jgi:hypothetical protein
VIGVVAAVIEVVVAVVFGAAAYAAAVAAAIGVVVVVVVVVAVVVGGSAVENLNASFVAGNDLETESVGTRRQSFSSSWREIHQLIRNASYPGSKWAKM